MPRRCPDVSSPHLHRGRDLRCCALGKTAAGYGWLRVQLEQPGMLLLRCLGLGGPGGVAVAMLGPTGLDMLICLNSGCCICAYLCASLHTTTVTTIVNSALLSFV
jgi:hypothetical protein